MKADLAGATPEAVLGLLSRRARWGCEVTVSPAQAAALLRFNRRNREVRRGKVKSFAAKIVAGRFRLTHQGIAFDTAGNILDGQHRLMAVVEAKLPIRCLAHFNEPDENFRFIDRDLSPRTTADDLYELGEVGPRDGPSVAAAARILHHYDAGRVPWTAEALTTEQAIDVIAAHPLLVGTAQWAREEFQNKGGLPTAPIVAFGTLMREVDDAAAIRFLKRLAAGTDLVAGDPILALREVSLREGSRGSATRNAFMVRLVRAWNAHRRGTPVSKLVSTIRDDHSFPRLVRK